MSTLLYLKNIIKDKHIASITPTSSSGVRKVCSKIDFTKDNVILEYGPAAGVFSKYLLKRMTIGSELILIERNHSFVSILEKLFNDQRVTIYHDSAKNVNNIIRNRNRQEKVDYILSGIPFSFLPECLRDQIVADTHLVLNKGGKFLSYQTFFQKGHHLKDHIDRHFSTVQAEYHLFNIPPLCIYEAVK